MPLSMKIERPILLAGNRFCFPFVFVFFFFFTTTALRQNSISSLFQISGSRRRTITPDWKQVRATCQRESQNSIVSRNDALLRGISDSFQVRDFCLVVGLNDYLGDFVLSRRLVSG